MKKILSIIIGQIFMWNSLWAAPLESNSRRPQNESKPKGININAVTASPADMIRQSKISQNPERPLGEKIETTVSLNPTDIDGDKTPEVKASSESTKVSEALTDEERKKLHDEYGMKNLRKFFTEQRHMAIMQLVEEKRNQSAMMRSIGTTKEWQRTVWGAQTRRFPMETLTFAISIAAINGGMMAYDYAQNPLMMEQHFATFVDPIGHLSFYAFMMANGYATEFLNNRSLFPKLENQWFNTLIKKSPEAAQAYYKMLKTTNAVEFQKSAAFLYDESLKYKDTRTAWNPYGNSIVKGAYRELIPYLSLTVGSMTSHIVGDYLRTLQACSKTLGPAAQQKPGPTLGTGSSEVPGAGAPAATAANPAAKAVKDRLNAKSEDPCDVAWREWVMEKKFNQYSPALMSMIASTALSAGVTKAFKMVGQSGPYQSLVNAIKTSKSAVTARMTWTGFEVAGAIMGGYGAKALKFLTQLSHITLFTFLDTAIHGWIEDKTLNINMGLYYIAPNIDAFPRKSEILDDLLIKETKTQFKTDSKDCEKDLDSVECSRNDIEGWMNNFAQTMDKWREFNQTKAHQAHYQWLDKINKFQTMERFAFTFYKDFIMDLKTADKCSKNPEICKQLARVDMDEAQASELLLNPDIPNIDVLSSARYLNQRTFPLFGVDPVSKYFDMKNWRDFYKSTPHVVQMAQQERVLHVSKIVEDYFTRHNLDSPSLVKFKPRIQSIIKGLKSSDVTENGEAIDAMRFLANPRIKDQTTIDVPESVQAIFMQLLEHLGNPMPLRYYGEGFNYVFEVDGGTKDLAKSASLPDFYRKFQTSTNVAFNKNTDYLTYHMLCGPDLEKGDLLIDRHWGNVAGYGIDGFRELFLPPRIVNSDLDLDICSESFNFLDSNKLHRIKIVDRKKNVAYAGAFHAIVQNLKPEIKAIIESDNFERIPDESQKPSVPKMNVMDHWWEKYVEKTVKNQLETFKVQYEEIAIKFLDSQFKGVGNLFGMPLHSNLVKNSVIYSAMQESRTLSLIANEVIKQNLTSAEYSKFLVDPKETKIMTDKGVTSLNQFSVKPWNQEAGLLGMQAGPWMQDYAAIKSGAQPKLFKFQVTNEFLLTQLHNAVKAVTVKSVAFTDGKNRDVIQYPMDAKNKEELEKQLKELIAKSSTLTPEQIEKQKSEITRKMKAKVKAEFEKQIDEMSKAMESEFSELYKLIEKKFPQKASTEERAKPLRVLEFAKARNLKIANEIKGIFDTLQFASATVDSYANKEKTKEELEQEAARIQREKEKAKCLTQKRMGTMSSGGNCPTQ